jgi:hypothetical protein
MSRTVGGEYLLGEREREVFVRMMWRLADFLGMEILTYTVMSNHYHQLVRAPGIVELSKVDLVERLQRYYGPESQEMLVYRELANKGGAAFRALRQGYLRRMGNISEFQKLLKQGFSSWYNRRKRRRGTLWMERFKSVLVEDSEEARKIISTYIDLNPVRAQLVDDPKDYRHCSYAAALCGDERCQRGIAAVMGMSGWKAAVAGYRMLLLRRGHRQVAGKRGSVSRELLLDTLKREGELPRSELLRLRVRYFTDGLVLGSERFVEGVFQQYQSHFGEKRKSGARSIRGWPDKSIQVIRDLRLNPIS